MAVPTLSSGTVRMFMVLLPAVTAATAVEPSILTALCKITLPMAVMLHCNPMGTPMPIRRRQALLQRTYSLPSIRSTENRRQRNQRLRRPEIACDRSVASAAPSTPHRKTMINTRSSAMFSALVSSKK